MQRWSVGRASVVVGLASVALLGWQGVTTVGRNGPVDAGEHVRFAQYLDEHHRIPTKDDNYEYATPPLYHLLAIAAEHAVDALPAWPLELRSNLLTRALWLALVAVGAAAMTAARHGVRLAGAGGLALAALWGLDELIAAGKALPWSAGQFLSVALLVGLAGLTALIARELWPGDRVRAAAAVAVLLAYPVVYRMGVLFHPELLLAFFVALSVLLVIRGERRGWPPAPGAAAGVACAAAALTRQSAAVLIACVAVAAAVAGRRGAARYLAAFAAALLLVAGPWWVYAHHLWGNPLQSNLEPRASIMLDHEPRSFYVSFPLRSLVVHPYREDFNNELLPKLHAELWSDWFGAFHPFWAGQSQLDRTTASTQSVLGFVGDALAIGGLALVGVPAALRFARGRRRDEHDFARALLALVVAASFAAYVLTLIRFPQDQGDPIKSSYLVFTAPFWAVFSVAAWSEAKRRSHALHAVLAVAAGLYVVSYTADLVGVFT